MKKNFSVNLISETLFTTKGHGVHSAFIENARILKQFPEVQLYVNSNKSCDIVHVHTTGPYGLFQALRAKKCVISAHLVPASLKGSLAGTKFWLPLYSRYLNFFYHRADLLLANSLYTYHDLQKNNSKTSLHFLPLGVNLKVFFKDLSTRQKKRKELNYQADDFLVLGVGQIQPRKGIETLVNLAKQNSSIKFLWVGGRPFGRLTDGYAAMSKLITEAPANLRFVGEVPYEEMNAYYSAADVFFLPSFQETFGLAIIEAAAVGLPLLLRDLPNYHSIFDKSYLAGDSVKDFSGILQKIKKDTALYQGQVLKSLELAAKHDLKKMGERLIYFYENLLDNKNLRNI